MTIRSKPPSKLYDDNYDLIFRKICQECQGFGKIHTSEGYDGYYSKCEQCKGIGRVK